MGKSPGKWLKALLLLGKKSSKSSNEENVPKSVKKQKEKRRWSFGKSSAQQKNVDTQAVQDFPSRAEEAGLAVLQQEQSNQQYVEASAGFALKGNVPLVTEQFLNSACEISLRDEEELAVIEKRKREEWAAVKIQTAFRKHRALGAVKGLIRLQALVRGHIVRRQAGTTLRCVQALVRVQARVRARRVRMSEEGQAVQQKVQERRQQDVPTRKSLEEWDSSCGTMQEMEARMQSRKDGAAKRNRALAYAFSRQLWRSAQKQNSLIIGGEPDQSHWGWSWLERWMAARPWETALSDNNEENLECNLFTENQESEISVSEDGKFPEEHIKKQSETNSVLDLPSSCLSKSEASKPALHPPAEILVSNEFVQAVKPSTVPPQSCIPVLLPSSSPVRTANLSPGKCTSSDTMETQEASPLVVQELSRPASNGELVCKNEQPLKNNTQLSRSPSKSGIKRRSFSGPLKGFYGENSFPGSPVLPSYMATTVSSKAKARSHSNPKLRPETQEKMSPVSKRRTSLPTETKQSLTFMRVFRSSSTKGFASGGLISASKEGGA